MADERPVVIVDIDGVLADFTIEMRRRVRQLYPDTGIAIHGAGGQKTWDWSEIPRYAIDQFWETIPPGFWRKLPPLYTETDRYALLALARDHVIHYMTERRDTCRGETSDWLWGHGMPYPENLHHVNGKAQHLIDPFTTWRQRVVAVIDDKPFVLQTLIDADFPVYARDWPYNRHISTPRRVGSIEEFVSKVMWRN